MSSITWTPAEAASEARAWQGRSWRAVEAQHRVSTLRLVDGLAEQALLEQLLESSKPALPAAATPVGATLHYLLATPFRYPPRQPGGSRFRAATDPGVFYCADERRTACAELGYWRWRFLQESPALERLASLPHTLFQSEAAGRAINLMQPPFDRDAALWMDPLDYSACQRIGAVVRDAQVQAIRYRSVRDPGGGACTALLTPAMFTAGPLVEQTWRLTVTRTLVQWQRDSALHAESFEFAPARVD